MNAFAHYHNAASVAVRDILHDIEFPKYRLKGLCPIDESFQLAEDEYMYSVTFGFSLNVEEDTHPLMVTFHLSAELLGSEEENYTFSVTLEDHDFELQNDAQFGVLADALRDKTATVRSVEKAFGIIH